MPAKKRATKKGKGKREPKLPRGRPSKYTPEIAKRICDELSTGKPLTIICKGDDMPSDDTVRNWAEKDPVFSRDIARARDAGFDQIAMDALAIADEVTEKDTIQTAFGPVPNKEWILRAKLRVDTRMKLLSKWDPKRYGEKLTAELSGPNGGPIESAGPYRPTEADEETIKRIAETRERLQGEASRDRE